MSIHTSKCVKWQNEWNRLRRWSKNAEIWKKRERPEGRHEKSEKWASSCPYLWGPKGSCLRSNPSRPSPTSFFPAKKRKQVTQREGDDSTKEGAIYEPKRFAIWDLRCEIRGFCMYLCIYVCVLLFIVCFCDIYWRPLYFILFTFCDPLQALQFFFFCYLIFFIHLKFSSLVSHYFNKFCSLNILDIFFIYKNISVFFIKSRWILTINRKKKYWTFHDIHWESNFSYNESFTS